MVPAGALWIPVPDFTNRPVRRAIYGRYDCELLYFPASGNLYPVMEEGVGRKWFMRNPVLNNA